MRNASRWPFLPIGAGHFAASSHPPRFLSRSEIAHDAKGALDLVDLRRRLINQLELGLFGEAGHQLRPLKPHDSDRLIGAQVTSPQRRAARNGLSQALYAAAISGFGSI